MTNNGRSPEQIENDENCNVSNALSNYQLSTGLNEISFHGVLYGVRWITFSVTGKKARLAFVVRVGVESKSLNAEMW